MEETIYSYYDNYFGGFLSVQKTTEQKSSNVTGIKDLLNNNTILLWIVIVLQIVILVKR